MRLGEIVIDASTEPRRPLAEVEDKLRAEAAKLAPMRLSWWSTASNLSGHLSRSMVGSDVDVIEGRKDVGVAIKYQR